MVLKFVVNFCVVLIRKEARTSRQRRVEEEKLFEKERGHHSLYFPLDNEVRVNRELQVTEEDIQEDLDPVQTEPGK